MSVFVRTGSQHEAARDNGISHVVEHMAFKGTRSARLPAHQPRRRTPGRRGQRPHRQGPHAPSTCVGLARDARALRAACWATSCSTAASPRTSWSASARSSCTSTSRTRTTRCRSPSSCSTSACYGSHPLAQPVIGQRAQHRALHARRAAGLRAAPVQRRQHRRRAWPATSTRRRSLRAAEAAFGAMPRGSENRVAPPAYAGRRAHARAGRLPADACGAGLPDAVAGRRRTRPAWSPRRCSAKA